MTDPTVTAIRDAVIKNQTRPSVQLGSFSDFSGAACKEGGEDVEAHTEVTAVFLESYCRCNRHESSNLDASPCGYATRICMRISI